MTFFIEQSIKVTGTFKDVNGVLVDPTVTAFLRDPKGNKTSMVVTRASTGVYSFTFIPLRAGTYWYQWQADGALTAAYEASIEIAKSKFEG